MQHHPQRFAVSEYASGAENAQEVRMIREFSKLVNSGQLDSQWPTWTLKTQQVLDACFQSAAQDGRPVTL